MLCNVCLQHFVHVTTPYIRRIGRHHCVLPLQQLEQVHTLTNFTSQQLSGDIAILGLTGKAAGNAFQ